MISRLRIISLILSIIILGGCSFTSDQENIVETLDPGATISWKLSTSKQGIYVMDLSDIGWDDIAVEQIRLSHRGNSIPFWIENINDNSKLFFYSPPPDSKYTAQRIYFLEMGAQSTNLLKDKIQPDSVPSAQHGQSPATKITIEENLLYDPLLKDANPWMWTRIGVNQDFDTTIKIPDLETQMPARINVYLYGNTQANINPDHHVVISINSIKIDDMLWDGMTAHEYSGVIPPNILNPGNNSISFHMPGDTGALVDLVYLDRIEIEYPFTPNPQNQQTLMDDNLFVRIDQGTEKLEFLDISDPEAYLRIANIKNQDESFTIYTEADHRYWLASTSSYYSPDSIVPFNSSDDFVENATKSDILILSAPGLLNSIEKLAIHRASQGYNPSLVSVDDIYNHYNFGYPEPVAIQKFIQDIAISHQNSLEAVLLIGDASYDHLGFTGAIPENTIPSMDVFSVFGGWTVSDNEFVQIDTDPMPDIPIGRIPASTPSQVNNYIDKIIQYEELVQSQNDWQRRILAIADGQEARFKNDAQRFLDLFDSNFDVKIASMDTETEINSSDIVELINQGYWVTAYYGHGSLNMWGKDNLFNIQDAASLNNKKMPTIVINMTCLTGFFTHPSQSSLAEAFLLNDSSGAVAVLAPTSLTLPGDQQPLSDAVGRELQNPENTTIADVLSKSWNDVQPNQLTSLDVIRTFLLFGDPMLQIRVNN